MLDLSDPTQGARLARLRRKARRLDLGIAKSRKRESADNFGGLMLFDVFTNALLAGARYDLDLDDLDQELREREALEP